MVYIIISSLIIIGLISLFFYNKNKKAKKKYLNLSIKELEERQTQLQNDNQNLNASLFQKRALLNTLEETIVQLNKNKEQTKENIDQQLKQYEQNKKANVDWRINEYIKQSQNNKCILDKKYQQYKINSKYAVQIYSNNIDKIYQSKEEEYYDKILTLQAKRAQAQKSLESVRSALQAAAAASLRQKQAEEKITYYMIQITKSAQSDIKKIWPIRQQLSDPSLVSKVIWSAIIQKPTNDLCNRVLGNQTKCGIYKITNRITNQCYIGQSVDIALRFKNHIKSGLGIDNSPTNKLYNAMLEYGILNFSFELLEECQRGLLNEKERYWIDMYNSNNVGYNSTLGVR